MASVIRSVEDAVNSDDDEEENLVASDAEGVRDAVVSDEDTEDGKML